MASSGPIAEQEAVASTQDDEGRGDVGMATDPKEGKKSRKFKPFEAMRKLFKGGRKRTKSKDDNQISVVSVKAKSTTALTSAGSFDDDDDDSDGGFKSHHSKQKPLQGGNRSISEDSVFNPGDRGEPSITALKTVAVSEENLNKNAFQNELFSKLKKRHSQYSDDDDGLPQSPVPPMTTADILGGPLKPVPGKSSSRESEKSLISVDSSDNEGDDPFLTKWNSPLKPRRSSDQSPPPAKTTSMDLEAVKRTPMLSNEAAKFKRSVKPRKQNRQSRKKKDAVTALGLPSLNEESPTKLQAEENAFATPGVDIPTDTTVLEVSSGPSEKPTVSLKPTELPPKPVATKPSFDASAKPIATKPSLDASVKPVGTNSSSDASVKSIATKPSLDASAKSVATKPVDASGKPVATKPVDASVKPVSVTSPVSDAKRSLPGTVKVEVKKEPTSAVRPSDQDISRGRSASLNIKEKVEPPSEKNSELSDAFNKLKRKPVKSESDELPKSGDKPDAAKPEPEVFSFSLKKEEKLSETKTVTVTGRNRSVSESANSVQKREHSNQSKVEELKPVAKRNEDPSPVSKPTEEVKPVQKSLNTDKPPLKSAMTTGGEIKPTLTKQLSSDSNKEDDHKSDTSSVKSESFKKDVGFKVGSVTPSPKEDYKQKRQSRSKTLPEQPVLPDEFSSKVQRAKSQRADAAPVVPTATGIVSQRHSTYGTPSSRKVEPKQHETKPSGQPEWMALVRNRKPAESMETNETEPKKEVLTIDTKDANKEKGNDKSGDKMSKSLTFSSASNSSTSPEEKKESFTISNSRSASVKIPSKVESKPQSGPVRFGSVKTGTITTASTTSVKSGSITTTASSISKSGSMSQSGNSWTKTPSATQTSVSRSVTSTTPSSSSKPDSIKNLGSSVTEVSKDSKVSPTEGVKKDFGRVQSVKTPSSTSDTTPAWKSSSVKTANKTPVQSAQSSSDKKESVPAWRSGINKPASKVTIEIIEKEPKQEVVLRKKSPPAASTPEADSCRDSSSNRSSKVLDMVKSFQKLQVN